MNQKQRKILESHWDSFIPFSFLERNHGISKDLIHSVKVEEFVDIGKFPGLLVIWRVELKFGVSKIVHTWFSNKMKASLEALPNGLIGELLWENPEDLSTLFQMMNFRRNQGRVTFLHGSSFLLENVTRASKIKTEATNQHFLLDTATTRIHLKIYSNPHKGHAEVRLASEMASTSIHPSVLGSIDLIGPNDRSTGTLAFFSKEIANFVNLDILTGQIYSKLLQNEISGDECLRRLERHVQLATSTLCKLHRLLNRQEISPKEGEQSFKEIENILAWKLEKEEILDLELNSDAYTTICWHLSRLFHTVGASTIHGDVWGRQFTVDENEQVYILDLEDSTISFLGYDIGSWINSILQQGKYFSKDRSEENQVQVETIAKRLESILWQRLKSLDFYRHVTRREVDLGRYLRSIHELDYLLAHQPSEIWLIHFIRDSSENILRHLKTEMPQLQDQHIGGKV